MTRDDDCGIKAEVAWRDSSVTASDIIAATARVVAAVALSQGVADSDADRLPDLVRSVGFAFHDVGSGTRTEVVSANMSASVRRDCIVCQECGRHLKVMRRHLLRMHGMSPQEYRDKWRLPSDYPMVASSYAELRSRIGRNHGAERPGRGEHAARAIKAVT